MKLLTIMTTCLFMERHLHPYLYSYGVLESQYPRFDRIEEQVPLGQGSYFPCVPDSMRVYLFGMIDMKRETGTNYFSGWSIVLMIIKYLLTYVHEDKFRKHVCSQNNIGVMCGEDDGPSVQSGFGLLFACEREPFISWKDSTSSWLHGGMYCRFAYHLHKSHTAPKSFGVSATIEVTSHDPKYRTRLRSHSSFRGRLSWGRGTPCFVPWTMWHRSS